MVVIGAGSSAAAYERSYAPQPTTLWGVRGHVCEAGHTAIGGQGRWRAGSAPPGPPGRVCYVWLSRVLYLARGGFRGPLRPEGRRTPSRRDCRRRASGVGLRWPGSATDDQLPLGLEVGAYRAPPPAARAEEQRSWILSR